MYKEQEKLFLGSGWGGWIHQMQDFLSGDEEAFLVFEQQSRVNYS